ncbi:MAG: hypothetical protein V1870_02055 [Candidatus Aenigmatarchaeota archaeon]
MKSRGRPSKLDPEKVRTIVQTLINNPDGMWIRQIAKQTSMHPTTATKYIHGVLFPMVDIQELSSERGKTLLKVIKLRPMVIERLEQGQKIGEILRFLELLNKSL